MENGFNGITVEDENRKVLVGVALNILRDPQNWWASSVEMANKYSWDKTAELCETLIKEVASVNHQKKKNNSREIIIYILFNSLQ